ncbi:DUF4260 domain-containing protein [Phenylobacterium montanum]|uniref:DUF4260 domain-containing protein n=1 Tax=Phenylobacterium montanum TaxID=2823693 RepID=A0A975FVL9_9CAUL|nr:DUF4260 domain-containing protein [Caulobacter sp. S6]QUD86210.1 DUF4260 domain-containing protein [Caulobacter sp. S6]
MTSLAHTAIAAAAQSQTAEPFTRGAVGGVRTTLKIEAAAILTASLVAYGRTEFGWLWFAVLFLAPDLSMLGYFAGRRIGAVCYNLAHSYATPLLLGGIGIAAHVPAALPLMLIWTAHIAFDRLLGYGLKYATAFGDTHLGRVGKA